MNRYVVGTAALLLAAVPCLSFAQVPAKAAPTPSLHSRVFDLVWRTVQNGHYDPKMNGVDWRAVRKRYEPQAQAAKTDTDFYAVLNAMLGELKQSHLGAISPEVLREAEGTDPDAKDGESGDPGMTVEWIEKKPVVVRVTEGGPAEQAGIKPGYVVTVLDGKPLQPRIEKLLAANPPRHPGEERVTVWAQVNSLLAGTVDKPYQISVKDESDAEKTVTLTPRKSSAQMVTFGALPPLPAEIETKTLAGGVGYIRFSIFLLPLSDPVKTAIRGFAAKKAPGIVLDLRGNRGGIGMMASGIAGVLVSQETNLGTMKMREALLRFPVFPQPPVYRGPMVVLTDEGSISTSEIMAAGLQELHRAKVVGRTTAGMVLPSQIIALPDGGRLQFVFADFKTPKGTLLEGRGVIPDVPVTVTRATLLASSSGDPILDAALAQLQKDKTKKL